MSIVYADAGVLILKLTVCPTFTLMSVAKPWIVASPAPVTSHTVSGVPVWLFSHATALISGLHGSVAALAGCAPTPPRATHNVAIVTPAIRRTQGRRDSRPAVARTCGTAATRSYPRRRRFRDQRSTASVLGCSHNRLNQSPITDLRPLGAICRSHNYGVLRIAVPGRPDTPEGCWASVTLTSLTTARNIPSTARGRRAG